MKILVMGLPGSGKTYFSERVSKYLDCAWYNADSVREMARDWDFSKEGRIRQAKRMRTFADFESNNGRIVICDFVCPTEQTRKEFDADLIVWMNTIKKGRFQNTNMIFVPPQRAFVDFTVAEHLSDASIWRLADKMGNNI